MGGGSFHYEMEDTMKKGMNPEAVEQMGQQIQDAGEQANQIFEEIASKVEGFDWTGEDRDKYVSEFTGTVRDLVTQVKQQCEDFAERAKANAQSQRKTSS